MPHPISSRASISGAVVAALLQPRPHRTTLRCVGSYLRDLAQLTATLHRLPNPIVRLFRGNNNAPLPSYSSSRGRRLRLGMAAASDAEQPHTGDYRRGELGRASRSVETVHQIDQGLVGAARLRRGSLGTREPWPSWLTAHQT